MFITKNSYVKQRKARNDKSQKFETYIITVNKKQYLNILYYEEKTFG